jgi:hypothetical protein
MTFLPSIFYQKKGKRPKLSLIDKKKDCGGSELTINKQ